jgi:peptidoglycan/LPS O-acetylase OafA/YrhL
MDRSWLWVDFFFVLSGFIMCYVYHANFETGVRRQNFVKFLGARFARIYPLYFITTLWVFFITLILLRISAPMDPFFAEIFNPWALPSCLFLIQSMHIGFFTAPLNTPSWSLSTEWWVYVIFPFILPLFIGTKIRARIFLTLFIITFFLVVKYFIGPIAYGSSGPTLNMLTDFGFIRCLAGFLAGMLTFAFFQNKSGYHFLKRDWVFLISFLGVLAAMHFGFADLIIIVFFPFIIICAAYNNGKVKRLLETRPLQRIGDWSYSIYMVHMPIILTISILKVKKDPGYFSDFTRFVSKTPSIHGFYIFLIILALTLFISALAYRFVEVPARNYINGLLRSREKKVLA